MVAEPEPPVSGPGEAAGHGWPVQEIVARLAPPVPGFSVEVVERIDSTNSELMRRARAGWTAPVLLVANRQTAGRGRLGRSWFSEGAPAGAGPVDPARLPALTFSFGMALAPHDWSGLSLAVGVALADSLHPSLGLKWPNDVWLGGRKVAGILIETANMAERRFTVIGVGINIAARDAAGLSTAPAGLHELAPDLDAPAALLRVAPALVQAVARFETLGFGAFRADFERRDVLRGLAVSLSDGSSGTACGVDGSGALLVHTSAGMKSVTSAEVSVRPAGAPAGHP